MTKDQFFALKRGDVVIENRSGTPRKVLAVHLYTNGAGLRYGSISLRQLRASWPPVSNHDAQRAGLR